MVNYPVTFIYVEMKVMAMLTWEDACQSPVTWREYISIYYQHILPTGAQETREKNREEIDSTKTF